MSEEEWTPGQLLLVSIIFVLMMAVLGCLVERVRPSGIIIPAVESAGGAVGYY
jgi:hypothetical protein